ATAPAATATAATPAFAIAVLARLTRVTLLGDFLFLSLLGFVLLGEIFLDFLDRGGELRRIGRRRARGLDRHARAFLLTVGQDLDAHAVAILDLGDVAALAVEHVESGFLAGAQRQQRAAPA